MKLVECYRERHDGTDGQFDQDLNYYENELYGDRGLLEALDVNLEKGIKKDQKSLQSRTKYFGTNKSKKVEKASFCKLFFCAFDNFMLKILLICAIITISVDMVYAEQDEKMYAWIEGTAILIAVILVTFFTALSEH